MPSEYIVILWFIPVTLFIVIPLSICFCWLAIRCVMDLADGEIPFIEYFSRRYYIKTEGVQKRREPRASIEKRLLADISDGINSFTGLVENISRMGLCIRDVPENISIANEFLSVVIRTGADEMQVVGRPCWQYLQQPKGRKIGLEITSSSSNWNDYVLFH